MKKITIGSFFVAGIILFNISYGQTKKDSASFKVVNDSFANSPFDFNVSLNNIYQKLKGVRLQKKQSISNSHTGLIDTLYYFINGRSVFCVYKSAERSFLRKATIVDKDIKLTYKIAIGMTRLDLQKAFSIPKGINSNIIVITDQEEFSNHKLHLSNNKLIKIELNFGID